MSDTHAPFPWREKGRGSRGIQAQDDRPTVIAADGSNVCSMIGKEPGFEDYPRRTVARRRANMEIVIAAGELHERLTDLMNYTGGWDQGAHHPCGRAAALLARIESKGTFK